MHEAAAAVLVVNLATNQVEYANLQALAMSGEHALPVAVDEWSRRAGLRDPGGGDLADSVSPLSRVARGEPVAGELIGRDPARASRAAAPEQRRQRIAGEDGEDVDGPMWVTGFPLGGKLGGRALVVFLELSGTTRAAKGADLGVRMRDRAVVATDLSFVISDATVDGLPLAWANPAFTRITGYALDEALGRNCRFLQGPDTDQAAVIRMREAMQARLPVVETLLNYRKDGTAFWNQVSLTPVLDADGELVNWVGVQVDVTERVLVEEERERALAAERRARSDLALLDRVSQAVYGLRASDGLQRVTDLLSGGLLPWAAVLVRDGRRVEPAAASRLPDAPGDVLGDVSNDASHATDPLGAMTLGQDPHETVVDLRTPGEPDTVTGRLAAWVDDAAGACTAFALRGRMGTMAVLVAGGGPLPGHDLEILREVTRRAGLSLENAVLYAREHALSEALQRAMLPKVVEIPGLDVWASYTPNLEHAQVGGDWFDVLPTTDDTAVAVVGDVVGHDIEAAATMGQVRGVIRAYAYEIDDPAGALMRADHLIRGMTVARLASAVLVVLRREGNGWRATWSSAGHLPPLLRRAALDGHPSTVVPLGGGRGPLLGLADVPRRAASARLEPDDTLVLYTDGLIERRARPMPEGIGLLTAALGRAESSDAASVGHQLLHAVGESPEDDAAVVVLRVPGGEAAAVPPDPTVVRQRRRRLDRHAGSISEARAAVAQAGRDWALPRAAEAELVVSELVTNALRHGEGELSLRLQADRRGFRLEVEDASPAAPQVAEGRAAGHGGYGLRLVQRLASWGWYPTRSGKVVWAYIPADAPAVLTPR